MFPFLEAQPASGSHGCVGKPAVFHHAFGGDVVMATRVADYHRSYKQTEDRHHMGRFTFDDDPRCTLAKLYR